MATALGARGCGAVHSRTVTRGAPAKEFRLDCPPCELALKGTRRGVVQSPISKSAPGPLTYGMIDADPMWSSTPDTVPLTPDEERTDATRRERGKIQIEMLQALAAMRATGVEVPAEAMWLLEKELPPGVLRGTVVCANSHDVPAGSSFCPTCGVSMAARAVLENRSEDAGPAVDLSRLHPQSLKKMCRDRGLSDKGGKDQLISRLAA
jgi:hypothetical protein